MIAIGSDHGGFELKGHIIEHLKEKGIEVKDFGTYSEASVDYPDCAKPVCKAVLDGECECGILICGTGIGISMAANKFKGIRAALCGDVFSAKMSKEHNNANIISYYIYKEALLCLKGKRVYIIYRYLSLYVSQ